MISRAIHKISRSTMAAVGLTVMAIAPAVKAQSAPPPTINGGVLDHITADYLHAGHQWVANLLGAANHLFALLAVISVAFSAIKWLLSQNNPDTFFTTMTRRIFRLSLWLAALQLGPGITQKIIDSFAKLGAEASGISALSPSGMIDRGVSLAHAIFSNIAQLGLGEKVAYGLPMAFIAIVIVLCFALAAFQVMYTLVTISIVQGLGVIMLGFGALDATSDMSKAYFSAAINNGVRLMVLYAIVGVGWSASNHWLAVLMNTHGVGSYLDTLLYVFVACLSLGFFVWSAPAIANTITTGAISVGGNDAAAFVGGAATAGVGVAAASARHTGSAVGAAAKGSVQASVAGMSLAREGGSKGLGAVVRGLGGALGAAGVEAGRSVASSAGFKKMSPHAVDGSGRTVTNLGTRAANRLNTARENLREGKAAGSGSSPLGNGPFTPTGGSAGSGGVGSGGPSGSKNAASGGSGGSGGTASGGSGNAATAPPRAAEKTQRGTVGEAIRSIAPPPLPHVDASGPVSLDLQSKDE